MEVNDNDLRKTAEKVDRKLNSLYAKWMAHFKTIDTNRTLTDDFVFTEDEEEAWKASEQNFTKRIATVIPTKRRVRVTLRKVTSTLRLIGQNRVAVKSRLMNEDLTIYQRLKVN